MNASNYTPDWMRTVQNETFDEIAANNTLNGTSATETDSGEIVTFLFYYLFGTIGAVGNTFVIIVLLSAKELRKLNVNILLTNQSCVDLLASVAILATSHIVLNSKTSLDGLDGELSCRFWKSKFFLWFFFDVSVFSLLAVNVDRYIAVVYPYFYSSG